MVTLAMMFAVAACSGPSGNAGGASNGTLTIGVPEVPTVLDPGQNYEHAPNNINNLVAGTLTTLDPDGLNVSNGLAESVEPGTDRFVVKLKPDLKFSDGSPLTATDVQASFERYLSDETHGTGFYFTPIEKVTARDDLTVDFELNRPYTSLPYVLAYRTMAILPAKVINSRSFEDLYKTPLPSAGQFTVQSFGQDQITLQANPHYAGEQPSTQKLVFKKIADSAARLAQVQGGQIDFAFDIAPKAVGQLSGPVEARVSQAPNGMTALVFNNRENSVLSDVRIRQALAVAVDREQINEVAFAGNNELLLGLWPEVSQYKSEPFLPEKPDLERAEELLAGTKCANGCKLRLIVSQAEHLSDTAIVVQQNLKAIGVDVDLQKAEAATISEQAANGNFDLYVDETWAYGDDPDMFLGWQLGSWWAFYSGYDKPAADALIEKASATAGSARDAAVAEADDMFEKDLHLAPLVGFLKVSASRVPEERFNVNPNSYFHVD